MHCIPVQKDTQGNICMFQYGFYFGNYLKWIKIENITLFTFKIDKISTIGKLSSLQHVNFLYSIGFNNSPIFLRKSSNQIKVYAFNF